VIGALLAIPVAAAIQAVARDFHHERVSAGEAL
jgi:predicted PurR-regulated permease PerM